MKLPFYLLVLFLLFCIPAVFAQQDPGPVAERNITLNIKNESLKKVLDKIAEQGKFTFSYPSSLIDPEKKVSLVVTRKTVREVLYQLFNDKISWKAKGNYVILSAPQKSTSKNTSVFILNGYVVNGETGEKIPSVSIYEGTRMISTITNKYGYFSIKLDDPKVQLSLKVSKQNYIDTLVTVTHRDNQTVEIRISPVPEDAPKDTVTEATFPNMEFLIPSESAINTRNISDTLYRTGQISFLPILGSNYRLSGNVINDYSLNILGGYSLGTRKAELAGLFNINRGDAQYVQVAGLANAVGGNFKGVQIAGYLNMVRKSASGMQIGGFGNLVWDSITGGQLGGFFNFNRGYSNAVEVAGFLNANLDTSMGVQVAGFLNNTLKPFTGVQVAGFTNAAIQEVNGVQVAGFLNATVKDMQGVQVAGFGNVVAKSFSGVQVSGFFNAVFDEIRGTQVATVLNFARKVKGSQIALINISDSCSGVPVGLLSFVRTGYHRIELSADEVFYTNLAFRTGTRSFHNILFAGIRPEKTDTNLWTFGYGAGTSIILGKKTLLDLDLTSQQINKGTVGPKINLLTKLSVGIEQRISKGIHLSTGPVLSAQLTNKNYKKYPELFHELTPNIFLNEKLNKNTDIRCWIGWKLGLRFF